MASYSNGQQLTVGKLAVATVNNPTSLHAVGGNELIATALTGTPVVGQSGTGSAGTVLAGSLEKSTVDIAAAFTSLLTFQRSYQANSRAITTSDQILQETIQLIHA
jgi:flagellar hook protein FlgE